MTGGWNLRAFAGRLRDSGRSALARRVGIDPRALATLRISLGLLVVLDVALRSRDLVAFYTDAGVLPRAALREFHPILAQTSLFALSGSAWVQAVLLVATAGFALALLVGYRTRLATAGSLVLVVSLHARNPLLLNGGDVLLRRLLFWGLFLPLGERWSLDASRENTPTRRNRLVTTVASVALLAQVVLVYVVNAALKLRGDLWLSGEAVRYVFSLGQFTVLLGDVLANYPDLLRFFAHVWFAMILSSVLLVGLTGRARAAFVALFVGMHLGMALTLRLDIFPLISAAGLLPFLPPLVWDTVESAAPTDIGRRLGWFGQRGRTGRPPSSLVSGSMPRFLEWMGRLRSPAVACLLVAMLGWNAAVLGYVDTTDDVTPGDTPWNMFAPEPMQTDGWYVVPGELASGERIDAFHGRPVRWDRPPDVSQSYPNERWRKYLKRLRSPKYADQRDEFADYLCDRWNRRHDDELVRLSVYYVAQPTRLDGPEPTRRIELGNYSCSAAGSTS